jgi:proteasome accessory factor B
VDRLERLVNLVAALIDTPRPLTRREIAERTPGYSDDPAAARRNFERDKELLRQMGFPLVVETPEGAGPEEAGYRIPREQYELPDPGLDEQELEALRLAASAVHLDSEWGGDAAVAALRKLGGAGDGGEPGVAAALPGDERAAVALAAVGERRRVRFAYRGEERTVDPWRISFHRGHWYLAGFDHGRGAERLYRLDRVDGELRPEGPAGAFERPPEAKAQPPKPWQLGDGEPLTAVLLVDADQARWARQELGEAAEGEVRPDGSAVFRVEVTNRDAFRSFVLGFLEHAEVLGPPDLRAELVAWLESVE